MNDSFRCRSLLISLILLGSGLLFLPAQIQAQQNYLITFDDLPVGYNLETYQHPYVRFSSPAGTFVTVRNSWGYSLSVSPPNFAVSTCNTCYPYSTDLVLNFDVNPVKNVVIWYSANSYWSTALRFNIYENGTYARSVTSSHTNGGVRYYMDLTNYGNRITKIIIEPIDAYKTGVAFDNLGFTVVTNPPIGSFDTVSVLEGALGGWSQDPDSPTSSNSVNCYVDGNWIGQTLANLPGSPGPPNHRFSLRVPAQYHDGNQHSANCWASDVVGGDPSVQLPGSPRTFVFRLPTGSLDGVNIDGIAHGVSRDPDTTAPIYVDFYVDALSCGGVPNCPAFAGRVLANLPNHGFQFVIPDRFRDGQQHTLYAHGVDTNLVYTTLLTGAPRNFTLQRKVKSVTFEHIPNSNPGLPIDNNPRVGGGLRVFPDQDSPGDQIDRRWMRVRARHNTATAGVRIYFRNFDLDDPSATGPPVDTNGDAGWDNRGDIPEVPGTQPAGYLSVEGRPPGHQCTIASGPLSTQIVSCLTDANGEAWVDFAVTRGQGDNFAVAASLDVNFLPNVTVNGMNLAHPTSGTVPIGTVVQNPCESAAAMGCRTSMLTAWRRLHIEYDSMGQVSKNYYEGNFDRPGTAPVGEVEFYLGRFAQIETDRYAGGTIKIGDRRLPITSNGIATVIADNPSEFDIAMGQPYVLYDDDDFNSSDGELPDGDEGEPVVGSDERSMLDSTDNECSPNPNPGVCSVLAPAYIRPVYDLPGSNDFAPFFEYLIEDDRNPLFDRWFLNKDYEAREDFWAIYLLNAYQHSESTDNDPETPFLGIPFRTRAITNNLGVVLYLELNRGQEYNYMDDENPGIPEWRNRPVSRRHELAREVGFMFGGHPTDTTGEPVNEKSLMAEAENRRRGVFGDVTLEKIRKQLYP